MLMEVGRYLADRYKQRALVTILLNFLAAAGYIIFLRASLSLPPPSLFFSLPLANSPATGSSHIHADYAALFLQIIGVYATAPCLTAWNANNVQPHYKRATSIAMCFICTNSGGEFSLSLFCEITVLC